MDNSSSNVISKEHDDSETHMEHQISQHMEHSNQPKEEHSNQVPLSLLSKSDEHSNQDVESQGSLDEHSSIKNEEQISDLQTMESQGEQHSEHDVGHPSTSQKDLESNAQHMEVSNQPPEIVTQSRATTTEIEEQISDFQSSLDNTQISQKSGEEEINDSPIEQVRLTVPNKDDPTLPCLTFRTWILGITTGAAISFVNQYFGFRQNKVHILPVSAQIPVLLIGKLMAAYLPQKSIRIPKTKWLFSLNPGPFNIKEHTLITIFANVGSRNIQATTIITIIKAFYNQELHPLTAILLTLSTQLLGYGWAGLFRRFLVDSPYMWWPSNLIHVSIFRALHEEEIRPKGGLSKRQFFLLALILSFSYHIVPGFLFPSISTISFVCWIWKSSVTAHQLGSGLHGLGIGSFGIDWGTVTRYIGSPMTTPPFVVINILFSFIIFLYIIVPICYWTNTYRAKRFPIFSYEIFDFDGQTYNLSRVLNETSSSFDENAYESYSKVHMSIMLALSYGLSFAVVAATISHFALFYGRLFWQQSKATFRDQFSDVHTRLMKKNYEFVPQWWFFTLLVFVIGLAMLACEGFSKELQLRYWGVLLAMSLALFFTLPLGVIAATTTQRPALNVITELITGYIIPGKPVGTMAFKAYGTLSTSHAINILSDFKLGTYMKIPPKSMFVVQLVGTIVACTTQFITAWWLINSVENICQPSKLPKGSPWTCPADTLPYDASIIWGVVGPLRVFGQLGNYKSLNYFFLFGILSPLPVWVLARMFPNKKWITKINMPVILAAAAAMPPIKAVNYICWLIVATVFNVVVFKRHRAWWARHNNILAGGLDSGFAFMTILIYFTLRINGIKGINWWGAKSDDRCPLAHCPTAAGINVEGCPVFR